MVALELHPQPRVRFTIEQRHLTDPGGKPVSHDPTEEVSFHTTEAGSADEAVRIFIKGDAAELLGDILRFPGFQAVATVRKTGGVYTLQVGPTSERIPIQ